jgi:membrane protein
MRERLESLRARHGRVDVAFAVYERYEEILGGMMAAAVTLSLFLALLPILLVTSAVVGFLAVKNNDLASSVVDRMGLTGAAATTVTDAIAAASKSRRVASVVGFAGLLWTGLGAAGAMKSAIDRAWQVQGRGIRDRLTGLVWLVGATVGLGASIAVTSLVVAVLPRWAAPFALVLAVATAVLAFWWTFRILAGVDVGWRPHLPGAILAGVGFEALTTVGAWIVPRTVGRSSALYGSLGAVFAILAWMFLFGRLFVFAAVGNVVLYERRKGTVTVGVEVPRVPGAVPVTASRAGAVDEPVTP